jgi:hypothetical protein
MFDVYKYYDNKAFDLPQDVQDTILAYFERLQTTANMRWKDHYAAKQAGDTLKAESQLTLYHARLNALTGAKYLLAELGIYIDYDWAGHRGEWFFPDYADAEAQEDWLFSVAD